MRAAWDGCLSPLCSRSSLEARCSRLSTSSEQAESRSKWQAPLLPQAQSRSWSSRAERCAQRPSSRGRVRRCTVEASPRLRDRDDEAVGAMRNRALGEEERRPTSGSRDGTPPIEGEARPPDKQSDSHHARSSWIDASPRPDRIVALEIQPAAPSGGGGCIAAPGTARGDGRMAGFFSGVSSGSGSATGLTSSGNTVASGSPARRRSN